MSSNLFKYADVDLDLDSCVLHHIRVHVSDFIRQSSERVRVDFRRAYYGRTQNSEFSTSFVWHGLFQYVYTTEPRMYNVVFKKLLFGIANANFNYRPRTKHIQKHDGINECT